MSDNALLVGMSLDEFWFGDPELYFNYVRVYETRIKQEQQNIWATGARVHQALESAIVFPAGLIDSKVMHSMPKYPECPYSEKEEYTEEEKELEIKRAQIHFKNWVDSHKGR